MTVTDTVPPSTDSGQNRILRVQGGHVLDGQVRISGAKNAALKGLIASILSDEELVLYNVPMIGDVTSTVDLLRLVGVDVDVDPAKERVSLRAEKITRTDPPKKHFSATRASVVIIGALLGRMGEVTFYYPGGDKIGTRSIDVHLDGLRSLGAEVVEQNGMISARADILTGSRIFLDYPTHTGTETIMMAACRAVGTTEIINACSEPEVVWLGELLNRMGARITGLGTPYLTIEGVERLRNASSYVIPDRLEAATFAAASVVTGGTITLRNVVKNHMTPISHKLRDMGAQVWHADGDMHIIAPEHLQPIKIQTLPYPGFPTDSQATFMPLLTQANGDSVVQERIYDDRLRYVDELNKMGANIRVVHYDAHGEIRATTADVYGPTKLYGTSVNGLDIRSAVSVVIAGLVAEGETRVSGVDHIDRGYQDFVPKLNALGAEIIDTAASS